MPQNHLRTPVLAAGLLALTLAAACQREAERERSATSAAPRLSDVLAPRPLATALRSVGALHGKATTTFEVTAANGQAGGFPPQIITTTTELWIDDQGNFRFVEENDQDGGREILLADKTLAVALKYGKMITRTAREPEPTTLLAEAVGGPFALWEAFRSQARVETNTNDDSTTFTLTQAAGGEAAEPISKREHPEALGPSPLRAWRDSLKVTALEGRVQASRRDGTHWIPDTATLEGRFSAVANGVQVAGHLRSNLTIEPAADAQPVALPEEAEPLWLGQRTVEEERALLRDLPGRRDPAKISNSD